MKKVLFGSALFAITAFGASFEGVLSDAKCKHGDESKAGCISKCIEGGSDAVLLSGDEVYTLKGDKAEFVKHAGHKVKIDGALDGKVLTVTKISM
ncbi:MAG: hypothetical protein R2729_05040 [Bryobacteraceae bacterium]